MCLGAARLKSGAGGQLANFLFFLLAGRPCGRSCPPPSPCVCSCSCECHHMLKCCVLHAMASPALACSGVLSPRGCVHASVLLRCRIHVHCGRVERAHTFSAEQFSRSMLLLGLKIDSLSLCISTVLNPNRCKKKVVRSLIELSSRYRSANLARLTGL